MPSCQTKFHGEISFEPEQVLQMPKGLFGFPEEKQFLLLELPSSRPMVFMQSVRSTNLCFVSLPIQVIEEDYKLALRANDLRALGYSQKEPPEMGRDLLCLALLTIGERQATTANLAAPLVIDIAKHRGMQVIVEGSYSHYCRLTASRFGQSAH
jgi:flagellar assembly factor FliW